MLVDAFTKRLYVRPLKNKSSASMIKAFNSILKEAKAIPIFLFTDMGTEFRSKPFLQLLKSKGITPYSIYSHIKSSFSERVIRTLFDRLQRFITHRGTNKFIDQLQNFVKSYNNTVHSVTKRRPNEITKADEYQVWETIFKKYLNDRDKPRNGPKLHVGQVVRISRVKLLFEKGESLQLRVQSSLILTPVKYCRIHAKLE